MEGKRAKGQANFRRNHSTTDHLVTLRIIVEEWCNNKSELFCFLVDFRKYFDTLPKNNMWNRLEELKVPFELRVATIRLYENFISNFKNTEGWSVEINCNIGFKQGCPLSPTLFGIYIDKLETVFRRSRLRWYNLSWDSYHCHTLCWCYCYYGKVSFSSQ